MKNHSDAVNAVRLLVSDLGGVSIKCTTGVFRQMDGERPIRIGEPGTPDVVACIGSLFLGIEVKFSDDDTLTDEQRRRGKAIEEAGGVWVVADFRFGRNGLEAVRTAVGKSLNKTSNIVRNWAEDHGVEVHPSLLPILVGGVAPMIPRPIVNRLASTVIDMGGVIVSPTMSEQALGALIGGVFFGIEYRIADADRDACECVRKAVESSGGKWITIDTQCADLDAAIRQGVHYSTAKTTENIDASIQHWCEHFSLDVTNDQAAMLAQLMKPGIPSC